MTKNGSGSGCVASSTVTCRSCIASRRLDCARGVARLISSTRTTFATSGPGRREREGEGDERREPVQRELHRLDDLQRERAERTLDEEDEREHEEQPERDRAAVDRAGRDDEDGHREEVDEPAGGIAGRAPVAPAGDESGRRAVRDEDRREQEREDPEQPGRPTATRGTR